MQREAAIFEERLEGRTKKQAIERLRELLIRHCRIKSIPSMSGFIYSGASSCGTSIHIVTSKFTGDFKSISVDGESDEAALSVTLSANQNGTVTYVEDPRTV